MRHNRIVCALVMILVIVLVVICVILACPPVRAAECRLEGKPEPTLWEPEEAVVLALAQCLEGECGGCSVIQQQAVCCVVFNRVDSPDFPDTLLGVITAPKQFHGYSPDNPVRDDLYELAYQEIVRWHNGEAGVIGPEYLFFWGDGRRNHFTTAYHSGKEWCEG